MHEVRLASHAMGCRFELIVLGDDKGFLRAAGEAALVEAEDAHQRLTRFSPDSIVSRLNRAPAGQPTPIDSEMLDLLSICEQVRTTSDGAFDITATGPARSPIEINRDNNTALRTVPGAQIDLGGVGKGFAIDLITRELSAQGVRSAFVHAGSSSVAAFGKGPDRSPWRVSLDAEQVPIELDGSALSVSGTEQQPGHIVDPATGHPGSSPDRFAVVGPSAALCDAWSTAAYVLKEIPPGLPARYRCVHISAEEAVNARSR